MSLPVENISREDLDWNLVEFQSSNNGVYKKLKLISHTKISCWMDFRIVFSKFGDKKPWILVKGSEQFRESLGQLDDHLKDKFESGDKNKYCLWIKPEYPGVRFHLSRLLGNGPHFVDIVEDGQTKRLFGLEMIYERLGQQSIYGRLEFEFFYICTIDGEMHCLPKLKRVFIEK